MAPTEKDIFETVSKAVWPALMDTEPAEIVEMAPTEKEIFETVSKPGKVAQTKRRQVVQFNGEQ